MVMQAGHAAELVDHDRQVVAVAAELAQQVVQALALGHEGGRAQQRADVEARRALQLEQVLRQQDADDVFFFALVHRKARVRGVDHQVQQRVERRVDVDQVHARRGDHHVAGRHVGHAQHAFEHHARLGADDVVVLGVGQRFDQLVARVGAGMDEFGELLEKAALVFAFDGCAFRVRVGHCGRAELGDRKDTGSRPRGGPWPAASLRRSLRARTCRARRARRCALPAGRPGRPRTAWRAS